MQTPKKFSSFSDQVSWISDEKGIKIKDREYAEEMLRQIGYFPLMGGYKHLFRISNTKKYKAGTSFEEIVSLYKFDAELRELFFKYLLQIERQMRSLMSYYFTEMYGAEQKQYLDANNYNNTKRNHATIVKLIATLKRATTTTDYTYINYYRKTYGEIPLWVLANVLTFGNLSKMFRVFPQSLKSKVSKNFEPLNQHQMEQFLSVLTKYRNVCAHGERLFTYRTVDAIADTPLHKKLSLPQSGNQYEKGKQDLFAVVIAFRYLLPGKDFLEFKRKLIKEIDRVNREVEHISEVELLNKMGFPEIVDAHGVRADNGIGVSHHRHQRRLSQTFRLQLLQLGAGGHDTQIQGALPDLLFHLSVGEQHLGGGNQPVVLITAHKEGGNHAKGPGTHGNTVHLVLLFLLQLELRRLQLVEHHFHMLQKFAPGLGQINVAPGPLEQLDTQIVLQPGDGGAQIWLRDVEGFRRLGHVLQSGHHSEIIELIEFHGPSSLSCRLTSACRRGMASPAESKICLS